MFGFSSTESMDFFVMSVAAAIASTDSPMRRPSGRTTRLSAREMGSSMSCSASRPLICKRMV